MRAWLARNWALLLPYALLLAIVRAWFAPGLIAGEDFVAPPFTTFTTLLHSGFWPPSIEPLRNLGQNMQPWWPSFPLWAVVGVLYRAGVPWTVLERVFWLWPFFVLAVAMPYRFFRRRGIVPAAAAAGAALYAVNTWTIGSIERGHIPALVAYALMPAVADRFLAMLEERRMAPVVGFALLVGLQAMYEVRFAYLSILLCALLYAVLCIRRRRRYATMPVASRLATAAGIALAATLYWWLPLLLTPLSLGVQTGLGVFFLLSGRLTPLHALALFYPYYHHNVVLPPFAPEPVEAAFFLLPALAAAGYIAGRKRLYALPFVVGGIAAAVLLSGPRSIFGFVSTFLYQHLPGFDLFRDETKLFSLVAFAICLGVALALNRALALARKRRWNLAPAVAVGGVLAIGFLMRDAFNPLRLSNFAATNLRPQDYALQRFIDEAPGEGAIMLFPRGFPGLDPSVQHPLLGAGSMALGAAPGGMNALIPPQADATIRTVLRAFFRMERVHRVLARLGVAYVVAVDDPQHLFVRPWLYNIGQNDAVGLLDGTPWLQRTASIGSDVVYRVRGAQPRRAAFYDNLAGLPAFTQVNGSEVVGTTAPVPGLLVQNTPFDGGWRLAMLPADAQPSGNALVDVLRFRGDFVSAPHLVVDTDLNGWITHSRDRPALLIFAPTAASEAGALLELPALLLVGLVVWRRR
ncbi:MAG TPA: hypothetical protein VIN40_04555 [Candidatus Tyrphobacter sp.]